MCPNQYLILGLKKYAVILSHFLLIKKWFAMFLSILRIKLCQLFLTITLIPLQKGLQDVDVEEYLQSPIKCDYPHPTFYYNPSHIVLNSENHNIFTGTKISKYWWILLVKTPDHGFKQKRSNYTHIMRMGNINSILQLRRFQHLIILRVNARPKSVFKDKIANDCPSSPSPNYVVVATDKASNYIGFVCKKILTWYFPSESYLQKY